MSKQQQTRGATPGKFNPKVNGKKRMTIAQAEEVRAKFHADKKCW